MKATLRQPKAVRRARGHCRPARRRPCLTLARAARRAR